MKPIIKSVIAIIVFILLWNLSLSMISSQNDLLVIIGFGSLFSLAGFAIVKTFTALFGNKI